MRFLRSRTASEGSGALPPGSDRDSAPPLPPQLSSRRAARRGLGSGLTIVLALVFVVSSLWPGAGRFELPPGRFWAEPATALAAQVTQEGPPAATLEESAIREVILRANQEQVQAIAAGSRAAMTDTATSEHYQELVRINQDLLNRGVTSIALVRLDWVAVTVNGATATATVDETWNTTRADSTTIQSRDRNLYTLVQDGGAWKIQADEHPTADLSIQPPAPSARPEPSTVTVPTDHSTSHNWSGYAATGGTFTAVTGTWTVPQPVLESSFGADAVWVGIGGVHSRDLIQAGTSSTVTGTGQAIFQAWIELLPDVARPVRLAVAPGDSVTVSIAEQGPSTWLVVLTNNTTGQRYQETKQYASSRSSAEWVVEAPASSRGFIPLDNFGTVALSNGSTVKNGESLSIAQVGAQPISMTGFRNEALAVPSALAEDGASFSVTRTAAPAGAPTDGTPGSPRGPGRRRATN